MARPIPSSPWRTPQKAAEYLDFHTDTLRRWRREGVGPPYSKHGKFIRYHVDDLDAWMRSLRVARQATEEVG